MGSLLKNLRKLKKNSSILQTEKGYTLIELAIVLLILSSLTGLVVVSFSSLAETKTIDHFIDQLKGDLYYTHMLALSRGKTMSILFRPDSHSYQVIGNDDEIFLERYHSPKIKIVKGSADYRIYFKPNGNIRNPGTIRIETTKGTYSLVFQLGKGRFYVR